jgi:hypothetical protein
MANRSFGASGFKRHDELIVARGDANRHDLDVSLSFRLVFLSFNENANGIREASVAHFRKATS